MVEITKTKLINMLSQQDHNVFTTRLTRDGLRVDDLTEDKRIGLPELISILNTDLSLVFMLHMSSSVACSNVKPVSCHFHLGSFSLFYNELSEEDVLLVIKSCILESK